LTVIFFMAAQDTSFREIQIEGGPVSKHIETFKSWSESLAQDIEAVKQLLESPTAHSEARKLAAAALAYQVQRLDLVPDHEQGIGALDDVMVLRVCMALASGHAFGDLPGDAEFTLGRLGNEADRLKEFLDGGLYDKLKSYCAKLVNTPVRGRHPNQLVDDEAVRKTFYEDLEIELKRNVPVVVTDPADAELRLKAYLAHKLGA
jgi:uncharacterized membrane protein YkvA (DUF1232 family)